MEWGIADLMMIRPKMLLYNIIIYYFLNIYVNIILLNFAKNMQQGIQHAPSPQHVHSVVELRRR